MNIEIVNPLDYSGWDDLLLKKENYSFFHATHWAKVLYETYGYEPLYFTASNKEDLLLLIPVMEIKSFLTGKRGVSLPFTDFSEPLVSQSSHENGVWNFLIDYGEKAGWKYIEIRGGEGFGKNKQSSSWYYEHTLDLVSDSQILFNSFRESNKRNIRKALKNGVEVQMYDSFDSMREFYRLNCMTRKMHGLPPQPFSFFKNVHEHIILKKHGLLAIARYQGKAIAASLYFHLGKKVIYKYGASDSRYQHLRANNLVMWSAIEWYCRNGFEHFSFGRTDPDHTGLKQFKIGWGAKERVIKYFRYNFFNNESGDTSSKVHGRHTRFFRKTPVPVLKIIGSLLYRHMG